ncbi:MAG: VCBS repeat-containing protein [Archangium sp.]|nr:VCBS repeat-containing protein [Archangium sp.]
MGGVTSCESDLSTSTCGPINCSPCPTPSNGTATCDGQACGAACNAGFHACGTTCASNTSAQACGASCTPCPAGPANSSPACGDGGVCGFTCNSGFAQCGGACVTQSVTSCGQSCTTCPTPANGSPLCNASGQCDVSCNAGFQKCGTQCVALDDLDNCGSCNTVCPPGPGNAVRTCTGSGSVYTCSWNCAAGSNRCPPTGSSSVCAPPDYNLACGSTCSQCSTTNAHERGVCNGTACAPPSCITQCNGLCVSTQTNSAHCGVCNNACGGGQACSQGECRTTCASGIGFANVVPVTTMSVTSAASILVLDVSGDGLLDLVSFDSSTLRVRLGVSGSASGFFSATPSSYSMFITPTGFTAGDLTGDGRPEIVAWSSSTLAVMRNDGSGGFTSYTSTPSSGAFATTLIITGAAIGEFSGAAPNDVVVTFSTAATAQSAAVIAGNGASSGTPIASTGALAGFGIGNIVGVRSTNVNGDGATDVVLLAGTNTVLVYLGTGTAPAFSAAQTASALLGTSEAFQNGVFEVADVTADAIPDVIVPLSASNVRIYSLSATPAISSAALLTTVSRANSIAVADIDGDGRRDVVTDSTNITVFRSQSGAVPFAAGAALPVSLGGSSSLPYRFAVADLTSDARPELIFPAGSSTSMVTLLNNGSGGFNAVAGASTANASAIVTGDINGDGFTDVVASPTGFSGTSTAEIWLAVDGGTFTAGATVVIAGEAIALARLDADSRADLITVNTVVLDGGSLPTGSPNARLSNTTTTGGTTTGLLEIFANGQWGSVCDDNMAGNALIVACRSVGLGAPVRLVSGFSSTGPIQLDGFSCTGSEADLLLCTNPGIGSHDCSHSEDVGLECSTSGPGGGQAPVIEVRFGTTGGTFGAPTQLIPSGTPRFITTADLDSDGDNDLIVVTSAGAEWFINSGTGTFSPRRVIAVGTWNSAAVGDVNNDGRRDVLLANTTSSFGGSVQAHTNLGAGFAPLTAVSLTSSTWTGYRIAVGDFNNDSKLDYVVGTNVYRGDGIGGFTLAGSISATAASRVSQVFADFDSDSPIDLVSVGTSLAEWATVRGDFSLAAGFVTTVPLFSTGLFPAAIAPARLNADARPDVVVLQGVVGNRQIIGVPGTCR